MPFSGPFPPVTSSVPGRKEVKTSVLFLHMDGIEKFRAVCVYRSLSSLPQHIFWEMIHIHLGALLWPRMFACGHVKQGLYMLRNWHGKKNQCSSYACQIWGSRQLQQSGNSRLCSSGIRNWLFVSCRQVLCFASPQWWLRCWCSASVALEHLFQWPSF